jgi:hypothetical protein
LKLRCCQYSGIAIIGDKVRKSANILYINPLQYLDCLTGIGSIAGATSASWLPVVLQFLKKSPKFIQIPPTIFHAVFANNYHIQIIETGWFAEYF